jgi:Secretion system C-terminal sorting domain
MKTLLFTTLFMCSAYVCLSQTINAPTIPTVGSEFTLQTMATVVSNVPVNDTWDFSNEVTATKSNFKLLPASASTSSNIFPQATHVRRVGSVDEGFVSYNGNQYKYWGNPASQYDLQRVYSTPVIMHVWPITPNQAPYTNIGTGVFQFQQYTITRTDKIDVTWISSGTLIMPGGKSYPNAVLLKVLRTFTDNNPDDPNKYISTLDMYHWWVDGYPVPLAETRVFTPPTGQGNPTSSSTFRSPITPTDIEEKENLAVSIYPNPTNDLFYIDAPIGSSIKVLDIFGKEIKFVLAETMVTSINLSELTKGIYFVEVNTTQGIARKKIIKN